ncbi:peptidoglycan-binding protein [Sphingomonas sp. dw_22]|uniref:peptidoglycan-binding protein n=1 Tax=Sphingomonas sp. dw_22 TaxID=2721175 RepID=UPI001BD40538|nr:peptidoglycan-binding protein [Sphingomonas sp. dw_22]
MIARADQLAALTPAKRAEVILAEAQSQLTTRLWRAALGDTDRKDDRDASPFSPNGMKMDSLLELLGNPSTPGVSSTCSCHCACGCHSDSTRSNGDAREQAEAFAASPAALVAAPAGAVAAGGLQLGANARYGWAFAGAAQRTGIPAPALAAIVDAEAAKSHDGSWNTLSRNPRSSAAGLGQFLSGTWQDLAQTQGTWLNAIASQRGWLDAGGKVAPAARAELLALRYDPQASIASVADMAKLNLDKLEKSGIRVRTDSETLAKAAYLSHHLGFGDARKFLGAGIESGRARMLLAAQIGESAADQRIANAGNAVQAHRQWLLGFIERRIQPEKFSA